MPPLLKVPFAALDILADRSPKDDGFLRIKRLELAIVRGGSHGQSFSYDLVDRHALDAVVIAAHHTDAAGRVCVYLRSAIRPPLALRSSEPRFDASLWELPAGLVEPGEDPRAAAVRELHEELGFRVDRSAILPLGFPTFPAPAVIGEIHSYFHVRVEPTTRTHPTGDGSPLEEAAQIVSVPLDEALAACKTGELADAKTELALRRLAETV